MKQRLKRLLSRRHKQRIVDATRVPSAVLIPIYCKAGQYHILFTKRTDRVRTHKGQFSFPGGAYDESDGTLVNTALREASEEIGLMPGDVEVLGELDDQCSVTSNYTISPFVAFIPWPYRFRLNQRETERIIEVPIAALLEDSCLRRGTEAMNGNKVGTYFYLYQGDVIWGATARILHQFLDIYARLAAGKPAAKRKAA